MSVFSRRVHLHRPFTQNFIVGCILFCLPGIYVALTGLGAGGGHPSSASVANKTNALLYGLLVLVSLFGGPVLNILRPKASLVIGALGYPLYVGSLWYYDHRADGAAAASAAVFPLFAGAVLGITAAFLWTTASYVQFSYAEEKDKGLYISIQWALKSLGAIIGGSISLAISINQLELPGVSEPVYVAFIVIHLSAIFIALFFIVHPRDVVRQDGTHIAVFDGNKAAVWPEIKATVAVLLDARYMMLAPAQVVCEMAFGLLSSVNSRCFNLRTRSVNNFMFQVMQALTSGVMVLILDSRHVKSRRRRALVGTSLMGTIAVAASAGLIAWLLVNRVDAPEAPAGADWTDVQWPGLFVCYLLFGIIYAGYQMCTEYTLSATTNNPQVLARVAGMFKCYSAIGTMLSFLLPGQGVSFLGQIVTQLVLYVVGFVGLVWVIVFHIKDSNYFAEEAVIAPIAVTELNKGTQARITDVNLMRLRES